jgi:hypothetical protein
VVEDLWQKRLDVRGLLEKRQRKSGQAEFGPAQPRIRTDEADYKICWTISKLRGPSRSSIPH